MKIHKITLIYLDFDDFGANDIVNDIENTKICQRYPEVNRIETVDIGEWEDDNPLNNSRTRKDALEKYFPSLKE